MTDNQDKAGETAPLQALSERWRKYRRDVDQEQTEGFYRGLRHCADELDAALSRLSASQGETGWQPIETYRKEDAKEVLLAWADFDMGASIMYDVGFWHSREGAWCDTHHVLHNQQSHPTHWMPLPSPPGDPHVQ